MADDGVDAGRETADDARWFSGISRFPIRHPSSVINNLIFMAKTSAVMRNEHRKELVAKYAVRRRELVAIIKNPKTSTEARAQAYGKLRKLPRNSARIRIRNRCSMSGRPRGFEGFFGLSRIALREMALSGLLPGVRKASW